MSILLARNIFSLGIIKLARAITELTISEGDSRDESAIISLAFLDIIYSSELIIRSVILKTELEKKDTVSEIRKTELIRAY